jgi:hypothetical protein
MKRLLLLFIGAMLAVTMSAQEDYYPTTGWPYLYPDFMEGEVLRANRDSNKGRFNIHLSLSALHYVDKNGIIKEADTWGMTGLVIGEDRFRFVGGKMLKVVAEAKGGSVVKETRANYTAIVKKDGAMGTTALNSTTTKTFLYNQNAINQYNGYLLTDVYADLHAMKDDSENLPVRKTLYMIIGLEQIPAERKSVISLEGLDKKALKAFLKAEKIDWSELEDLVKVIDYITANRK